MMVSVFEVFNILNEFASDCDSSTLGGKFESIALKVEKNLLDPMHIWANDKSLIKILHLEG